MNSLFKRWRLPLMIIGPCVLWLTAHWARPLWVEPRCTFSPETCTPDQLSPWDRWALLSHQFPSANTYSNYYQNGSAAIAVLASFWVGGGLMRNLRSTGRWLGIYVASALWNAGINEWIRLFVQRARPYIYRDSWFTAPIWDYNSFYSGHTSFTAVSGTYVAWLTAIALSTAPARQHLSSQQKNGIQCAAILYAITTTLATGVLRVLASKHFPADVVVGGAAGSVITLLVIRILTGSWPRLRPTSQPLPHSEAP